MLLLCLLTLPSQEMSQREYVTKLLRQRDHLPPVSESGVAQGRRSRGDHQRKIV